MAEKRKGRIDWMNHLVGFVGVLFGVLIAFWLNNLKEENKEREAIRSALANIQAEMEENIERLDTVQGINQRIHDQLRAYIRLVDDEMDPVEPLDSLTKFQIANPEFISEDFESVSFSIELFQLSNVAWKTAERTNILSAMEYDLVKNLAVIYDFQSKLERFDIEITDAVAKVSSSQSRKADWRKLRKDIEIALAFATILEKGYDEVIEGLKADRK